MVPESQYTIALIAKKLVPASIVYGFVVLPSIHFKNQSFLDAKEIHYVRPYGNLPTKPHTEQLAFPDPAP
jgi:hypothetical protein